MYSSDNNQEWIKKCKWPNMMAYAWDPAFEAVAEVLNSLLPTHETRSQKQ